MKIAWVGNNKIDFLKKIWFKEKDMDIKMSSPAKFCKSNERGMLDCDKEWKAKSEIQSTWVKIYTLYCEPRTIYETKLYEHACFMKFRYFEDYEKMKELNKMLGELHRIMAEANNSSILFSEKRGVKKMEKKY